MLREVRWNLDVSELTLGVLREIVESAEGYPDDERVWATYRGDGMSGTLTLGFLLRAGVEANDE